ncbi:helix-turn-helix domain-containing protein [Allofournierella sp.]|uniref:helix-turn-helix domain-containing protein n=2 Tax=Allofournierella sp. TaxID=1940256 RepID=UPI003AB14A74
MLMQSYGKVTLKLAALMDARGITRNRLARLVNTRYEVVDKWYKGHVEKLDLDVLARVCFVLGCSVQDLLEYTET